MILKGTYPAGDPYIGNVLNILDKRKRRHKKGKGGGVSWSSYWTTRTPTGLTTTVITGVQIDLAWTNNGTPDYDGHKVYISSDNVTFTLKATIFGIGTTYSATALTEITDYYFYVVPYKGVNEGNASNTAHDVTYATALLDGHTVGLYDFEDLTGTLISSWTDKSGNNNHLLQAGADNLKPTLEADGVLFNNNYLNAVFAYVQPIQIYIVFKIITNVAPRYILDGNTADTTALYQLGAAPLNIAMYGGSSASGDNFNLALDTFGIVRILYNGANSSLQIDGTAAVVGNFGSSNAGGINLGRSPQGGGFYSHMKVGQLILRDVADSVADNGKIYDYLKKKNNELLIDGDAQGITDNDDENINVKMF